MSEIKLDKELFTSEKTGVTLDQDDSGLFQRLTLRVVHPVTNEPCYMEYSKEDSKKVLLQKEDGTYVKEEDVKYLKESWQSNEYENRLAVAWKPAERGVDIPEYWYDEAIQIIPKYTAMWDDVYVDKQKVKVDYSVGCTGTPLNKLNNLIALVRAKFPNDSDFKKQVNNIIGMYLPDHSIRPPYKSNNTITVYHMYYEIDVFNQLLKDYKVPNYDYTYCFWYGLKYDLDSSERYFKLVIRNSDEVSNYQKHPDSFIPRPQLPVCNEPYFAKIYSPDGTEADEYDVFFSTTPEIMKEYCKENNLKFPIPEDKEKEYIWTYGIVYDKNTLDVKQVKGYIKVAQDPDTWLKWL